MTAPYCFGGTNHRMAPGMAAQARRRVERRSTEKVAGVAAVWMSGNAVQKLILMVHVQEEGEGVMDMTVKEVAIYVETERVAEVMRVLLLPFRVAPFPFFDTPSGP